MNFNKKNVVVFGAAESGESAISLLRRLGAKPYIFDNDMSKAQKVASEHGVEYVDEKRLPSVMAKAYAAIVSPGIDFDCNYLLMAKALGLRIIPEIELAESICKAKIITVTGTNGKSSTVRLITSVLNSCGKYAVCGGNIGTAFSRFADKLNEEDIAVIEASSFQLATINDYHSDIAVITNVTQDHIDRHGSLDSYISAKAKIFEKSGENDVIIGNFDDITVRNIIEKADTKARKIFFSREDRVPQGVYIANGKIKAVLRDNEFDIGNISDLRPIHTHVENALATISVALVMNLPIGSAYRKIREFIPSSHTMQKICKKGDVVYIDDSKGTNVSATLHAVDCIDGKLVLIVGGREKGESYMNLFNNLPKKVKSVVFLGENASAMHSIASELGVSGEIADSMQDAVERATEMLDGAGTVLFSPACASFDSYTNYIERGEAFICAVNRYGKE